MVNILLMSQSAEEDMQVWNDIRNVSRVPLNNAISATMSMLAKAEK